MKFGLLGHPLGHSMSPFIHKRLLEMRGVDASYVLIDVAPEDLPQKSKELLALDGFNVTIPYKKEIIKYLDSMHDTAARYRSVNVVKTGAQNVGYNTDVVGFVKSAEHLGASLSGRVLMLGSGGVAQMMGMETLLAGGSLTVAARDVSGASAKALKKLLEGKGDAQFVSFDNIEGKFDFLINATPVGMYPNVNESPVEKEVVANCRFVFDAIYNPQQTLLAKYARQCGVKCLTGMEMLVRQAAEAQKIWLGYDFCEDEIALLIKETNAEVNKR